MCTPTATERGSWPGEGRGAVGELRYASENCPPTWQNGLRALTSVAKKGLAGAVGELRDPPAQVGPEDPAVIRSVVGTVVT